MSHHSNKPSSHVPLSSNRSLDNRSNVGNLPSSLGAVPLHQTYHHEEDHKGPRPHTIAHETEDRFEGQSRNLHESVVKKETVIDDKPQKFRAAPLPVVQPIVQPRVIVQDLPVTQTIRTVVQPASMPQQATKTVLEPDVHRNVVEKATIVKETILPEEKIEIQPVIHREREQTEVHKVVQPLHERDVMATRVVQATLADQVRAPVIENDASFQARSREADNRFASTKEYAALKSQTVQKSAIVEEHIHKTIIEEVQPVLYKETVVPVIIQETQPIYERIVEAPVVVTEERAMRDLGTQYAATSLNDQRSFQDMGQGNIPPQSFVETTTTRIIREEIPFSGQQFGSQQSGMPMNEGWKQTSNQFGDQLPQRFGNQFSQQSGMPSNEQWRQTTDQFGNQLPQQSGNQFSQQSAVNQFSGQQWNETSQMGAQDVNQKMWEQGFSQKNPLQPNVDNTRPF